jgi:hypothetical protein
LAPDAADLAGDEMGVVRILALEEDAVAAKDGRRAAALGHLLVGEVDLGVNAETAEDAAALRQRRLEKPALGIIIIDQQNFSHEITRFVLSRVISKCAVTVHR